MPARCSTTVMAGDRPTARQRARCRRRSPRRCPCRAPDRSPRRSCRRARRADRTSSARRRTRGARRVAASASMRMPLVSTVSGPRAERVVDERPELRVQHRLAAGEVVVARAERLGLVEKAAHARGVHHGDARLFGPAGDEAVPAGDVAQRAGELEPDGVERAQRHRRRVRVVEHGRRAAGRAGARSRELRIAPCYCYGMAGRAIVALWIVCAAAIAWVWLRPMHEGSLPAPVVRAPRKARRRSAPRRGRAARRRAGGRGADGAAGAVGSAGAAQPARPRGRHRSSVKRQGAAAVPRRRAVLRLSDGEADHREERLGAIDAGAAAASTRRAPPTA